MKSGDRAVRAGDAGTAAASIGVALWDGHLGHQDANLRAIHYDTNYDLSAQRRLPAE